MLVEKRKTIVLLKYEELYIVVDGFEEETLDAATIERVRYQYNERTCPINYLGVRLVAIDGDLDPHGVFEFVRIAFAPDETVPANDEATEILMIFSELNPVLADELRIKNNLLQS